MGPIITWNGRLACSSAGRRDARTTPVKPGNLRGLKRRLRFFWQAGPFIPIIPTIPKVGIVTTNYLHEYEPIDQVMVKGGVCRCERFRGLLLYSPSCQFAWVPGLRPPKSPIGRRPVIRRLARARPRIRREASCPPCPLAKACPRHRRSSPVACATGAMLAVAAGVPTAASCDPVWHFFGDFLCLRPRNEGVEYAAPFDPAFSGLQAGSTLVMNPEVYAGFRAAESAPGRL